MGVQVAPGRRRHVHLAVPEDDDEMQRALVPATFIRHVVGRRALEDTLHFHVRMLALPQDGEEEERLEDVRRAVPLALELRLAAGIEVLSGGHVLPEVHAAPARVLRRHHPGLLLVVHGDHHAREVRRRREDLDELLEAHGRPREVEALLGLTLAEFVREEVVARVLEGQGPAEELLHLVEREERHGVGQGRRGGITGVGDAASNTEGHRSSYW